MDAPTDRSRRLSESMLAVLRQAAKGAPLTAHLRGRSAFGGFEGTVLALYRRGLLDHATGTLTEAGQQAVEADRVRREAAQAEVVAARSRHRP